MKWLDSHFPFSSQVLFYTALHDLSNVGMWYVYGTGKAHIKPVLKEISPEYPLTQAEAPVRRPPDWKSRLIGEDPDWREKEKGTTEGEMVRWHHQLDAHEFEQALRDSEGQGILACWMKSMGPHRVGHDLATEQQGLYRVIQTQTMSSVRPSMLY